MHLNFFLNYCKAMTTKAASELVLGFLRPANRKGSHPNGHTFTVTPYQVETQVAKTQVKDGSVTVLHTT